MSVTIFKKITLSKFTSDFVWNAGSLALIGFLGLTLNGIILAWRGEGSLGVFNLAFSFFVIVSQLAVCGIQLSVLQQCSWHPKDSVACRDSLVSGLLLVSLIGLPVSFGVFLGAGFVAKLFQSPSLVMGLKSISFGILFFCLNKVLLLFFNSMRQMRAMAIFQATRFALINIFIVYGILFNWPDGLLPISLSLSEFLLFCMMLYYLRRNFFSLFAQTSKAMKGLLQAHLHFGIRGFLSGVLVEMNTRIDILMLGLFVSDEKVGLYSFVAAFAEGFAQLIIVMRRNVDPIMGALLAKGKKNELEQFCRRIRRIFYPFMIGAGGVLVLLFPCILVALGQTDSLAEYRYVLVILVIGFVLISGYNCFIGLLIQGKRPGLFTVVMIVTVCGNIILNASLIPAMGVYGAAVATSFAYLIQTILAIVVIQKQLNVRI